MSKFKFIKSRNNKIRISNTIIYNSYIIGLITNSIVINSIENKSIFSRTFMIIFNTICSIYFNICINIIFFISKFGIISKFSNIIYGISISISKFYNIRNSNLYIWRN
uniref:Uncharacterized protein n=1 Tax=Geladintestivirus 2 TaxID=3233134 RepID=A0AAU8MKY0_9CAUD